ncbi:MAG: NADH-quinone oxidoreductase subunit G [Candidatus Nanopelagicales bacterium]
MTVTANSSTNNQVELITANIDGVEVRVPKGTLIIRAAEQLGVQIPRFCDHPSLEPVAACRMCLVEIEGMPKPQPSCAIPLTDGMIVRTQQSSEVAAKAQEGVMEFLLLNHPLDCPVCDKGGECPLQNQAMTNGRADSRFEEGTKRLFEKPININSEILLDRERCVSCARCTRFADEIAGDPTLELLERGARQQVGTADDRPFESYFGGNTIQICPVGALTSATYRFRSRPFDLISHNTICEHCASGCSTRTDVRRGKIMRRLAANDPEVNEEWNCDKGRFAFTHTTVDRIATPLIRENGELRAASWPEAIEVAAAGLANKRTGVLTGGRLPQEDAYAYSRFARAVLGTNNIDFRNRYASTEEADFLANYIAGTRMNVTYRDLETADVVVLVAFEPENESPIVQLRLRKAVRRNKLQVIAIDHAAIDGHRKLNATVILAKPGSEASEVKALAEKISGKNAIILVGERAAASAGLFSSVIELAKQTGAKLAWVPRRAGDRGAVEAGLLPQLLPGGKLVSDAADRAEVAAEWGVASLPSDAGLDQSQMITAANSNKLDAFVIGGVDVLDVAYHQEFKSALEKTFVVSLEPHYSSVTEYADVVLPVGVITEREGTFVNWEGRERSFAAAMHESLSLTDARVLHLIAEKLGVTFTDQAKPAALHKSLTGLKSEPTGKEMRLVSAAGRTGLVLAGLRQLIDNGSLQKGEPHLAATAREAVAKVSATTASAHNLVDGNLIVIASNAGKMVLPVEIADVAAETIWVPLNSDGSTPLVNLSCTLGDSISVSDGGSYAG